MMSSMVANWKSNFKLNQFQQNMSQIVPYNVTLNKKKSADMFF